MGLNATMIFNLLRQQPGRYVQHDMGDYRMKEANGADVTVRENDLDFLVQPTADHIDSLMDASLLIRDGSRYRPR
jgi:hypothetical protein